MSDKRLRGCVLETINTIFQSAFSLLEIAKGNNLARIFFARYYLEKGWFSKWNSRLVAFCDYDWRNPRKVASLVR